MLRSTSLIIAAVLFVAALAQAADEKILAKVGDTTITIADLNRILSYYDADKRSQIESNPQLKEMVLNQLVQSTAVFTVAKNKGFDKNPELKEQLLHFTNLFIANEYIKQEVAAKITVTDEEVKKYYDSNKDEFTKSPAMVKASHILVKTEKGISDADRKKARAKADDILKKVKAGGDFVKLAKEFSDDAGSKEKGGDLGFFPRNRMVKPFEDAAFGLKAGELSGIVETEYGYHIIKVEEKKDAVIEPFDKAKDNAKQRLIQSTTKSKVDAFIAAAMKETKAESHAELLAPANAKDSTGKKK